VIQIAGSVRSVQNDAADARVVTSSVFEIAFEEIRGQAFRGKSLPRENIILLT
jgi:hypothetical protein